MASDMTVSCISDPFIGVTLIPQVSVARHDVASGVMHLEIDWQTGARNDGPVVVDVPWADPVSGAIIARWAGGRGESLSDLRRTMREFCEPMDGVQADEMIQGYLDKLARLQLLRWWYDPACLIGRDEKIGPEMDVPACILDSGSRLYHLPWGIANVPEEARLSRFVCIRREGGSIIAENAEIHAQITFRGDALTLVGCLLDMNVNKPDEAFRHFLWRAGFLEVPAHDRPERQGRAFHEQIFHSRSRGFMGLRMIGMNFGFKGTVMSLSAHKSPMSDIRIDLPGPADGGATDGDALYAVMERRQSYRRSGKTPLTLRDIGLFLWRTVSTRKEMKGGGQELLKRPVPGGGAIHELEFYLVIHRCDGLAPGTYHYNGKQHALYALRDREKMRMALLQNAATSMNETGYPDCLIIITSRLFRLAWKYSGISYRLSLLNAGVAMEAFYLVATEMGLSPCALGSGDSAAFALASGVSMDDEPAIAEFVLNGPPDKDLLDGHATSTD